MAEHRTDRYGLSTEKGENEIDLFIAGKQACRPSMLLREGFGKCMLRANNGVGGKVAWSTVWRNQL